VSETQNDRVSEELATPKGDGQGRWLSILVVVLLCLAGAFALGMQIANLPSALKYRAERALAAGDFATAMKHYIKIRRIEHTSKPFEPKMRDIALTGIGQHYEQSKELFNKGQIQNALAEYTAAMALSNDYFFVFPSDEFGAPKEDKLLKLLDTIKDDSCLMAKVHSLRSEWDKARPRMQECERDALDKSSALFWETYVYLITWDWEAAPQVIEKLMKTSGMGSLLEGFGKQANSKKVVETTLRSLVPKKLWPIWTLAGQLKWFELAQIVERMGMELVHPGNDKIGSTGVAAPCDIVVRSAGKDHGDYGNIVVNGVDVATGLRGYNLVALEQKSGELLVSDHFDTIKDKGDNQQLRQRIRKLPAGAIVILAAKGKTKVETDLLEAFRGIGATFAMTEPDRYLWSHCAIGVKGAPAGSALEMHCRGASFLEVCGPTDFGSDEMSIKAYMRKKAAFDHRPVIYLSGKELGSELLFAAP